MNVYIDGFTGPVRALVVKEIDKEYVEVQNKAVGALGFVDGVSQRTYTVHKNRCWKSCRPLNKYGTRVEFSGCPNWKITA